MPLRDLVPLCGNCHPMVHAKEPVPVEEESEGHGDADDETEGDQLDDDAADDSEPNLTGPLSVVDWTRLRELRKEAAWEPEPCPVSEAEPGKLETPSV